MTPRRWAIVGMALMGGAFGLWAAYFIFRTSFVAADGQRYFSLFDDAMISMRYAWNLSHGHGLVWNPGERVEGYTNLLMVGLMALWTSVLDKSNAVLAVQLSGIPTLFGIASVSLLLWLELARGREVVDRTGFGAIAFVGVLLYYPLNYWTLMGMETGLLTLLLLAGVYSLLLHIRTGREGFLISGAGILGLSFLARPDSAPSAVLALSVATLWGHGAWRVRVFRLTVGLAAYLLLPFVQILFRASYYGSIVPLTYTLKMTGMPLMARLENGVGFVVPFFRQTWWAFLLACLGTVFGFSRRKFLLLLPPLSLAATQIFVGGDAWVYWRLLSPAFPFLVLLSLAATDRGMSWMMRRIASSPICLPVGIRMPQWLTPGGCLLASALFVLGAVSADRIPGGDPGFGVAQRLLLVIGLLVGLGATLTWENSFVRLTGLAAAIVVIMPMNHPFLRQAVLIDLPYQAENNKNHVNAAIVINELTTDSATVGVFWAGIIPYYTSRYAVDFLGKNDPYIARLPADLSGSVSWGGMSSVPGHNKYDLVYSILERRPTYVEGFRWGNQDLTPVFERLYVEVSTPGPDPAFLLGDPTVRWQIIPPEKLLFP